MKVRAPGKLLLTGAYAVLEGAPALVVSVDRYAVADGDLPASRPTPEVLAALAADEAPEFDARSLREGEHKLGVGSSAAILVASLGVAYARRGMALAAREVRDALFSDARRAHAAVQGGGSGVDVAASVYGGPLEYALAADGTARVRAAALPTGLCIEVLWCGSPAITASMRARVDDLQRRDPTVHRRRMNELASASRSALVSGAEDDVDAFIGALRDGSKALAALGNDADAPIFPPATWALAELASSEGAAFVPSGAGGGDVFVHAGTRNASPRFHEAAARAGLMALSMCLDSRGVHLTA